MRSADRARAREMQELAAEMRDLSERIRKVEMRSHDAHSRINNRLWEDSELRHDVRSEIREITATADARERRLRWMILGLAISLMLLAISIALKP